MVQWDSIKIYQYYSGCYAILIGLNTHVFCYFLEVICSLEEARQLLPELTKKTHDAVASFCRDHVSCALLHLTELNQPSLQTCIAMLPTPKVSCVYVRGIAMLPTPKVSCVYARVINHFHTCFKFCWKMWMDSLNNIIGGFTMCRRPSCAPRHEDAAQLFAFKFFRLLQRIVFFSLISFKKILNNQWLVCCCWLDICTYASHGRGQKKQLNPCCLCVRQHHIFWCSRRVFIILPMTRKVVKLTEIDLALQQWHCYFSFSGNTRYLLIGQL